MRIHFSFSCPMDWDSMDGDDTRRFCGQCSKHVTNVSNMTPDAARAFLERSANTRVCVQVAHDSQGTVQFAKTAAAAAALTLASPALADGTIPTLTDLATTPEVTTATAEPGPVLDVVDEDCGAIPTTAAPVELLTFTRGDIYIAPAPTPAPTPAAGATSAPITVAPPISPSSGESK